jgi:glutathione S-transferase
METSMKLHIVPGSPSSRKVEAVIRHLGLEIEIQEHNFFAGGLRKPTYLALNPNARVPTLEDGDFVLWESNAITQYLADRAGGNELFPRQAQARAAIVRWQFWELAHFNRAFGVLAFETVAKPRRGLQTDAAAVALAQAELARCAPVLESHIMGREYLVGDAVTLADYAMIPFEGYRSLVPFDWAPYSELNAYFDRMSRLEPWVRSKRIPLPAAA